MKELSELPLVWFFGAELAYAIGATATIRVSAAKAAKIMFRMCCLLINLARGIARCFLFFRHSR